MYQDNCGKLASFHPSAQMVRVATASKITPSNREAAL